MKTALNKGFTLVEMSIVMLILAILTGGILIGKDLIHAAEVRATVQQTEMFNLAYNTFQLKYNCWAGDCSNAKQLGFSDDFSIQLSKNDAIEPDTLLDYISPISTAHAVLVFEQSISVNGNLIPDGNGGLIDTLTGKVPMVKGSVVSLNGNNNCALENNLKHSLLEGSTGENMLYQAGLIQDLDKKNRVYLKLSEAFGTIGNKNLPAFWVIGTLAPGENSLGDPSLISTGGVYLQIASSYQPFAPATVPAIDAQSIDLKIDDGNPLKGATRSTSTTQTNLVLGPTYNEAKDVGPDECLIKNADDAITYNIGSNNLLAKCAMVIRMNMGGCAG